MLRSWSGSQITSMWSSRRPEAWQVSVTDTWKLPAVKNWQTHTHTFPYRECIFFVFCECFSLKACKRRLQLWSSFKTIRGIVSVKISCNFCLGGGFLVSKAQTAESLDGSTNLCRQNWFLVPLAGMAGSAGHCIYLSTPQVLPMSIKPLHILLSNMRQLRGSLCTTQL